MPSSAQDTAASATILVDADACPVKDEIYRVAERHRAAVLLVANSYMRFPRGGLVTLEVVSDSFDAADDRIAALAATGKIVITADILLAARCIDAGAIVLSPKGKPFTAANVGNAVTGRAISAELRSAAFAKNEGRQSSTPKGPDAMKAADRSRFLQALHEAFVALKKA